MSAQRNRIRLRLARAAFDVNVDLDLPASGITAVLGASGSGKTSLLRCVAGLEPTAQGLVRIAGQTWQDSSVRRWVPTWQRPLGYVFQEASLFAHLDVRANLRYGMRHAGKVPTVCSWDAALALLGLEPLLARRVQQLSGGESQRVAIARALLTQPQLLLLDEPLAAIDTARRQEILPWLERLRDELQIPMLYVTHASAEAARLADTLVVLQGGQVSACGPVAEVMAGIGTPALAGEERAALLTGVVEERDAPWSLVRVRFAGGSLWLRDTGLELGRAVRLRVLARDVSVATEAPRRSSIQNQISCRLRAFAPDAHPSQLLLQLDCCGATLLARITARAYAQLELAPGQVLWAQVKSVALVE